MVMAEQGSHVLQISVSAVISRITTRSKPIVTVNFNVAILPLVRR